MDSTWEVHGKSELLLCVNVTKYADYAYNITVYYVAIIMRSLHSHGSQSAPEQVYYGT